MIQFVFEAQLRVLTVIEALVNREEGQDMIEYALLAALIAVAAIVTIGFVGKDIVGVFQSVINGFASA